MSDRTASAPGAVRAGSGRIELSPGRPRTTLSIRNGSRWPIGLSSHLHLFEANPRLGFDRALAYGCHLDAPAGSIVWIEPGGVRTIDVVPFAGDRRIVGFNGLVDGDLDAGRMAALVRARDRGFADGALPA